MESRSTLVGREVYFLFFVFPTVTLISPSEQFDIRYIFQELVNVLKVPHVDRCINPIFIASVCRFSLNVVLLRKKLTGHFDCCDTPGFKNLSFPILQISRF